MDQTVARQTGKMATWLARLVPLLLSLFAVVLLVLPILSINPMRSQGKGDLRLGYLLGIWNPSITLALFLVALVVAVWVWPRTRSRWFRGFLALSLLALAATAVAARVNVFERMFSPLARPGFVPVSAADHLSDRDMVLGVEMSGQSAAYPVGIVAYHHIVNDELAGEPFVVTY